MARCMVQLAMLLRFCSTYMDAWLLKYEHHPFAKTVQVAATQKGKVQWLFAHKQFLALLSRFGTNANER
jgi:hypothetical protein